MAVTSLAFIGFVTEKMKFPPSGPIGTQESQKATDENIISKRNATASKKFGKTLQTSCLLNKNIVLFLMSSPFIATCSLSY
jgi:hypothetical protein